MAKIKIAAALAVAGVLVSGAAQAALIDRGGGMIYDSDRNITWLSNANLGAGSAYDDGFSATDGRMSFPSAVSWAGNLNYGGFDDWRLPTSIVCTGYACTGSELGHMYFVELSMLAGTSITSSLDPDYQLFQNVQSYLYWSGTSWAPDPSNAYAFGTYDGGQFIFSKLGAEFFAWAVRDGDVRAVPEPVSLALVGLGLAGLAALRRRRPLD